MSTYLIMKPHHYIFSIFSLQFIVIVALNAKTDVYTTLMHITRRRGFFQAKIICWILKKCAILFYIFVRSMKNIFLGEFFFHLSQTYTVKRFIYNIIDYLISKYIFLYPQKTKISLKIFHIISKQSCIMSNFCTAPLKVFTN